MNAPTLLPIGRIKRRKRPRALASAISEITHDVPIPRERVGGKRQQSLYPFALMVIGDSFTCPFDRYESMRVARRKYEKNNPGHKFITNRETEDTVRTWRIK